MPRSNFGFGLGFSGGYYRGQLIYGIEEQFPIPILEDVGQYPAKIDPYYSTGRGCGEIYDLKDLLFEVELLGSAIVGG